MNKLIPYLFLFFLLSGFSTKKELTGSPYIKEITFNFDYGVPIIKASINDKEYNFLFDTGMPTVLSESIAKELNLKTIRSVMGSDVNGNTKQESYVLVNEIIIGGISFKQIETFSTDLSAGFEIGCLKLDGVIGNNLIKNAIWEIDYEKKVIRLTDNIENFKIPQNASVIKFETNAKKGYYTPNVEIIINGKKRKGIKFDTGSNGGLVLPLNYYSKALDPALSVEYFGQRSAALYGKGSIKNYIDSKVKSIKLGDVELQNQIASFSEEFPMIGNQFFKNYRIIINYYENKIYMLNQKEFNNSSLQSFGFQTGVVGDKAIVSIIYKKSNAEKMGLLLGDEILEINDINVRNLISDNACNFLFNNPLKEINKVKISILRNGEKSFFELEKETLID